MIKKIKKIIIILKYKIFIKYNPYKNKILNINIQWGNVIMELFLGPVLEMAHGSRRIGFNYFQILKYT